MTTTKQSNGSLVTKIALAAAALVLLVLAATGYSEFLKKKLEGELAAQRELRKEEEQARKQAEFEAQFVNRLEQIEGRLASATAVDPVVRDVTVRELQQELQAAQAERQVIDAKLEQVDRQEYINSLAGAPPADPTASLSPEQQAVARAAAIGTVTSFNSDWGFVMLDAGSNRGLDKGTRLALRRSNKLIALIVISDIEPNSSVASMIKGGPDGGGNLTPEPGDEAIGWPAL